MFSVNNTGILVGKRTQRGPNGSRTYDLPISTCTLDALPLSYRGLVAGLAV